MIVEGDEDIGGRSLVIKKLKGRVLKMGEIQHVDFGKSEMDEENNSKADDKDELTSRGMTQSPNLFKKKSMLRYVPSWEHCLK